MTVKIDYDSIPRSYRDYLDLMVSEGEYLAIDDEVDWNLEIGAIIRRADETLSPSPIFNKVKDCPGFRCAELGFTKSGTPGRPWARIAPFVGAPLDDASRVGGPDQRALEVALGPLAIDPDLQLRLVQAQVAVEVHQVA